MISQEKEIEILKNIHDPPGSIRQRELSEIVGLTLGMTNTILKRFVQKGWITMRK
ncbi:MAG TPA: winged helix-turn-helix transcriptional regulator, partial [Spirochaetia bacterium]|nr:winged helix-turn-helix transcriptional regulator [Spirochaetia bacterium]